MHIFLEKGVENAYINTINKYFRVKCDEKRKYRNPFAFRRVVL